MGGSKSSSSSSSRNTTNTNNLNLDGVDGITLVGSEGSDVNVIDPGAFKLAETVVDYIAEGAKVVVDAVTKNSIDAQENAISGFEKSLTKINESNQSETATLADKAVNIAAIGAAAYAAAKIFGKK